MIVEFPKDIITKEEKFDWLHKNHDDILYAKKSETKTIDNDFNFDVIAGSSIVDKANDSGDGKDVINVKVAINTTRLMDSHDDVHWDGIWTKSLKENKRIKHVQEHKMQFDKIISDKDDLKAYAKKMTWKELGYDIDGESEVLLFDSKVRKKRNPFMYDQYKDGNVDNHSVGMIYVKIFFALNSKEADHAAYKEVWDEYVGKIANKKRAEDKGYFWLVKEAKVREGSAVVDGSNFITPTLSRKSHSTKAKDEADGNSLSQDNELKLEALKRFIN